MAISVTAYDSRRNVGIAEGVVSGRPLRSVAEALVTSLQYDGIDVDTAEWGGLIAVVRADRRSVRLFTVYQSSSSEESVDVEIRPETTEMRKYLQNLVNGNF